MRNQKKTNPCPACQGAGTIQETVEGTMTSEQVNVPCPSCKKSADAGVEILKLRQENKALREEGAELKSTINRLCRKHKALRESLWDYLDAVEKEQLESRR